jgi:prepilin-type N-terminal cleavage/methylation domain-containing protein
MARAESEHRGFALIELVIVLAVTAVVLALIASAIRTYSVRNEIRAVIDYAGGAEAAIAREFMHLGEVPPDAGFDSFGGPHAGAGERYIDAITVSAGRIDVRFGRAANAAIAGRTLSLTPYETVELEIVWVCGNEIPERGLKPLGFAGGGRQSVQIPTTVEARYLPSTCR